MLVVSGVAATVRLERLEGVAIPADTRGWWLNITKATNTRYAACGINQYLVIIFIDVYIFVFINVFLESKRRGTQFY